MSHGICFAFAIIGGSIDWDRVYVWYPIGNIRTLLTPSLRTYVEKWLSGQLSVRPQEAYRLRLFAAAAVQPDTG